MTSLSGNRISQLRIEMNLTQEELANRLSEIVARKKGISSMTISAMENGRRKPTADTLAALSKIFSVSEDYILGLSNKRDKDDDDVSDSDSILENEMIFIHKKDLAKYDNQPIFITFKNFSIENMWGILDCETSRLLTKRGWLDINDESIAKFSTVDYARGYYGTATGTYPLRMTQLMEANKVYVEVISKFPYLRGQYNGWYHHNENKTALIKENGLMLPYDGLGISYNAYNMASLSLN